MGFETLLERPVERISALLANTLDSKTGFLATLFMNLSFIMQLVLVKTSSLVSKFIQPVCISR
jgi:hypothetical protein